MASDISELLAMFLDVLTSKEAETLENVVPYVRIVFPHPAAIQLTLLKPKYLKKTAPSKDFTHLFPNTRGTLAVSLQATL